MYLHAEVLYCEKTDAQHFEVYSIHITPDLIQFI